jgi:hypothetical protein
MLFFDIILKKNSTSKLKLLTKKGIAKKLPP